MWYVVIALKDRGEYTVLVFVCFEIGSYLSQIAANFVALCHCDCFMWC